ncbi:protein GVQW3 [Aplysia californica]|uniref:Protein GVQW3 n=1 Tax=Aplysia californica TaxID=6500 RepID=A0ABM0JHN2_APLCA|nr:protein GVQW3 [Aplysia californica]
MSVVYGDICPSYDVVRYRCKRFKCGNMSIEDNPREGRPVSAVTEDNVSKVKKIVLNDRRVTLGQLCAETETGLSYGSVETILHGLLNLSKVSSRWVPRLFTPHQKEHRAQCSQQMIDMFDEDPDNFLTV